MASELNRVGTGGRVGPSYRLRMGPRNEIEGVMLISIVLLIASIGNLGWQLKQERIARRQGRSMDDRLEVKVSAAAALLSFIVTLNSAMIYFESYGNTSL